MLKKLATSRGLARAVQNISKRNNTNAVEAVFSPTCFPQEVLISPEAKQSVLPNGVKVLTEQRLGENAAVGIFIETGSRNEKLGQNGTARLLQQVNLQQSALANGTTIVAKTGRETTSYVSECLKDDVQKAIQQLHAAVFGKVDADTLEKVKKQYLHNLAKYEEDVNTNIFESLHETAFQGSTMALPLMGTKESINNLNANDVENFRQLQYIGPRITVVGVGNVDHHQVVESVNKALGNVAAEKAPNAYIDPFPTRYVGSDMRIYNEGFPGAHIAIGFKGAAYTSADYVPMLVISRILGSWSERDGAASTPSSRNGKAMTMYDKTGSFCNNFYFPYKDTGLIGAYLETSETLVEDACHHPIAEFVRLSFTISETDLARAKNALKIDILKQYSESSLSTVAEHAGLQMLTQGRRITAAELISRIDAVDVSTIKSVADTYFYDSDPVMAAIGRTTYVPDYNWLRAWTYRLRN